jgi:hypothetical protein
MKNNFSIILFFSIISFLFYSCGSGKSASCDAYGQAKQIENSDLAAK